MDDTTDGAHRIMVLANELKREIDRGGLNALSKQNTMLLSAFFENLLVELGSAHEQ